MEGQAEVKKMVRSTLRYRAKNKKVGNQKPTVAQGPVSGRNLVRSTLRYRAKNKKVGNQKPRLTQGPVLDLNLTLWASTGLAAFELS